MKKLSLRFESKILAKHTIVYGFGTFLNRSAALLLLPIYTRFLTTTDYGIKELIGITLHIVSILTATAVSSAIYRFYFDYDDIKDRLEVISTSIIALTLIGGATFFTIFSLRHLLADLILDNKDLNHYFLLACGSLWLQMVNGVGFNYLRAIRKSILFVSISALNLFVAIAFNLLFIIHLDMGVLGIFISTLITSALTFCYLTIPLSIKTRLRFSYPKFKSIIRFGLPLIPSSIGAFIVHSSDRFFIKHFCSISDAGLYSLGYRFGILPGTFISEPFNQVWMPRRLEVYKKENAEVIFGRIFTYFLALITFAGAGIAVLTKELLMIIADKAFWDAYYVIPIIVLANIVFTMHYHLNLGIIVSKKTKYLAYINFSNGFLVIVLNLLLIPRFGIYGAAFATLLAFLYKVALTYYFSSRFYKIHFEINRIIKIILAGISISSACWLVNTSHIYLDIIIKTSIILTYPIILFGIRFFSAEEKEKIQGLLNSVLPVRTSPANRTSK